MRVAGYGRDRKIYISLHKVVSADNSTGVYQHHPGRPSRHALVSKNPEVFQCDDDGNLTGRWIYEWDSGNRLIQMTTRFEVPGPHYQLTLLCDWMRRGAERSL